MLQPSAPLVTRHEPGATRAVVLLLHGGKPHSQTDVGSRSASWKRMGAIQRAISTPLHRRDVATWLLRYRVRGWNGDGATQIEDARWALDQIRDAHGAVPVVLLGHSMGGRTAIQVADDPQVTGVVGLAPWWDRDDDLTPLLGKHLRAAHGSSDKITSARHTRHVMKLAEPLVASSEFTDMGPVGHYMLRQVGAWNSYAGTTVSALLPSS